MLGRRIIALVRSGLFLVGMTVGFAVVAAEEPVELASSSREVPERGRLQAATMIQGKERSSFIVPAGWRMGLETQSGAILLQSAESQGLIEIRRIPLPEGGADLARMRDQILGADTFRERQGEYEWMGGACRSYIFDTKETTTNNLRLQKRICLMLRENHVLLVSLTVREQAFSSCLRAYEIVLASLRQE